MWTPVFIVSPTLLHNPQKLRHATAATPRAPGKPVQMFNLRGILRNGWTKSLFRSLRVVKTSSGKENVNKRPALMWHRKAWCSNILLSCSPPSAVQELKQHTINYVDKRWHGIKRVLCLGPGFAYGLRTSAHRKHLILQDYLSVVGEERQSWNWRAK